MFSDKFWAEANNANYADVEAFLSRMASERFREDEAAFCEKVSLWADSRRANTQEPLSFQQVAEFIESVGEPPPMFAEGIIPNNSLLLWSGKAKYGKSLACYQLMFDVATGEPLFGHFEINKPGPVLYIGMEDGKHEVNRRLRNFGLSAGDTSVPIYVNTDFRDYGKPENVFALRAVVEAMEPRPVLVVIDTLTESFDAVKDWNNRNEVKRAFRALRQFAQEVCTVVGITHNVKGNAEDRDSGDEVAGSLAVLSSADGYLSCYKRRKLSDGNLQLFIRGGGRGGITSEEFVIEMDTQSYHWRWLGDEEMEAAKRQEQAEARKTQWDKLESALRACGGYATVPEMAAKANITDAYARAIVREMVAAERIVKTRETKSSGAGKPAPVYGLPSPDNNNDTIISYKESRYNSEAETEAKRLVDNFMDAPAKEAEEYDIV